MVLLDRAGLDRQVAGRRFPLAVIAVAVAEVAAAAAVIAGAMGFGRQVAPPVVASPCLQSGRLALQVVLHIRI